MDRPTHDRLPPAPARVPGLLVSVRSASEGATAAAAGADLIDVKDPAKGPLGRPAASTVEAVLAEIGGIRPVSVALGELCDLEPGFSGDLFAIPLPPIRYAKLGLAGAGRMTRWWRAWDLAWRCLPPEIGRVGVIYADWQAAGAPPPEQALAVFAGNGCSAVLVDTFAKDGRSLLDHVSPDLLAAWVELARTAAPTLVLAGSLSITSLGPLKAYHPDFVAIRGAACRGGRDGRISLTRTRAFADALRDAFA